MAIFSWTNVVTTANDAVTISADTIPGLQTIADLHYNEETGAGATYVGSLYLYAGERRTGQLSELVSTCQVRSSRDLPQITATPGARARWTAVSITSSQTTAYPPLAPVEDQIVVPGVTVTGSLRVDNRNVGSVRLVMIMEPLQPGETTETTSYLQRLRTSFPD
jgi:hypothetical protein